MPRGRMLSKKISFDEKVAKLSLQAKLLYTWCIPHLDVKGRIHADIYVLKGIVPFVKELMPEVIKKCVQEFVKYDLVTLYGEGKYLQFKGFDKNQSIREDREASSYIPDPPNTLQSNSGVTPAQSNTNQYNINKYNISKDKKTSISTLKDKIGNWDKEPRFQGTETSVNRDEAGGQK